MSKPIYNKNIPSCCGHCRHARISAALHLVFCEYKGPVSSGDACRRYQYDPLKRVPNVSATLPEFSSEDFSL